MMDVYGVHMTEFKSLTGGSVYHGPSPFLTGCVPHSIIEQMFFHQSGGITLCEIRSRRPPISVLSKA